MPHTPTPDVLRLRRIILAILLFGMLGIAVELLLLGHTEDWQQWIPLALIVAALVVIAWHGSRPTAASRRAVQVTMVALIGSGIAGVALHYLGNREFQVEIDPTLSGFPLFWTVIRAHSPPAMAPGVMALLGLLGLAWVLEQPPK